MVAVVSGSGLGLFNSSAATGDATVGRGRDRAFVNTTTGNLIIRSVDDSLSALGLDLALIRTYNSRGLLNDDNGDNWRLGVHQRLTGIPGTPNSANSTVTKIFGDGTEVVYRYENGRYVSTDGDGAHDTLTYSGGTWTWQDGSGRNTETYGSTGQMIAARDADGNLVTYGYDPTSGNLSTITDASGQVTTLTYTGINLSSISTTSGGGQPATLVRYYYDAQNRLRQVVMDLTPNTAGVPLPDANGDGLYEATTNETYVTTYGYDGTSKRIASISQSDGSSISFGYTQIADGTYRVSSYTEAGQGVVTLPVVASALVSSETTTTVDTYNLINGVATPPGWSPISSFENESINQNRAHMQFDSAGNGFAVWTSTNAGGQPVGIYARRYNAASGTWAAPVNLSSAGLVSFEMDNLGNALVVGVTGSPTQSLVVRRFDVGSGLWSAEQVAATGFGGIAGGDYQLTASMQGGNAIIAFTTQFDTTMTPRYRTYAVRLSGGAWGALTEVGHATYRNLQVDAKVDSLGNATVLSLSYPTNVSPITTYAHVNRFSAASGTWSGPTQVDVLASPPSGNGMNQIHLTQARVELDAAGNVFATWQRGVYNSAANPQQLVVRRYDIASNTWGGATTLASHVSGDFNRLQHSNLSVDAAGNAMVVWNFGSGSSPLYASYYNVSSGTWSARTTVAASGGGTPGIPITNQNGRFSILYSNSSGFWSTKFENGAWTTPVLAINPVGQTDIFDMPAFGLLPDGDIQAVWAARLASGGEFSLFTARLSSVSRYTIPNGATWGSVALALYGNEAVVPRLQQLYSSIAPGTVWTSVPTSITVTTQVTTPANPPYYLVVGGDTWATIAQKVYNSTDAAVSAELARLMNNVALTVGSRLNVPSSITAQVSTGAGSTTNISYTAAPPTSTTANANPAVLSTTDTQTTTTSHNVVPGSLSTTDSQNVTSNYSLNNGQLSTTDNQTTVYNRNNGALSTTGTQDVTNNYSLNGGQLSTTDIQPVTTNYNVNNGQLSTTQLQNVTHNLSGSQLTPAGWSGNPAEFAPGIVNERYASIKYDAAGNGFATWVGFVEATGEWNLYVRRFDRTSGAWSAATVFDTRPEAFNSVVLDVDSGGHAVIAWVQSDGTFTTTWARKYNATNGTWTAAQALRTGNAAQTFYEMKAAVRGTRAIISWIVTGNALTTPRELEVTRFDGSAWEAPQLFYHNEGNQWKFVRDVAVAIDPQGNALVMYVRAQGNFVDGPMIKNLYSRYFSSSTGSWAGETLVQAGTYTQSGIYQTQVAFDDSGNAIATFGQLGGPVGTSGPQNNFVATRFSGATQTWGAQTVVGIRSYSAGNNQHSLTVAPSGDAVVAYSWDNRVNVRMYSGATQSWGAETLVSDPGMPTLSSPGPRQVKVSMIGGQAAVSWTQEVSSGTFYTFASRYTGSGWSTAVNLGNGQTETQGGNSAVAVDPFGNLTAIWSASASTTHPLGTLYLRAYYATSTYVIPPGATWSSVAGALYGVSSSEAGAALQSALGNPALIAGDVLQVLPPSLTFVTAVYIGPHYVIQSGDTWQIIANRLYGVNSAEAANALQTAMGSPTLVAGNRLMNPPTTLGVTVMATVTVPPYYTIPSGATWQGVANTLYGINHPNAGTALQAVLGSPALNAGGRLTGLPSSLSVTTQQTITVPAYYLVPSGATWQSIANAVYGVNSAAAGAALQSVMGNPSIAAGTQLTGLPATLSVTVQITVPPYYTIPSGATWQSIANTLYGIDHPNAGTALQTAMGNPALTAGNRLTGLPSSLAVTTTQTGTVPPYYTIPSGATWQSIANAVYGQNTSAAATALQAALGNPTLTAGNRLTSFPNPLSVTTTTTITVPAYYVVPGGATWASITQAVYGATDANAGDVLRTTLGNPTLTTGMRLTVPASLTYTVTMIGPQISQTTDVTDAAGRVTTYTQDSAGRLRSVLSPTTGGIRLETVHGYDADGNLTTITEDPSGLNRVSTLGYDARGNNTSVRDSLGNTVTRTYDDFNQITSETKYVAPDPDGAGPGTPGTPLVTRYVYDGTTTSSESHLRFVIGADGRVTQHQYNAAGQRTATLKYISALYTGTSYAETDLTTWANVAANKALLERTEYAYDFRDNLSQITRYVSNNASTGAGTGTPSITRFLYDQRGQLLQTIDPRGSATTPFAGNPNLPYATTYLYDGLGRVLSTSRWDSGSRLVTTLNAYDDANRIVRTTLANGLVSTSAYDRSGQLINVSQGTSANASSFGVTTYAYDSVGRLRIQTEPSGAKQFSFYDEAGRKTAQVDGDGSLVEFVYDRASAVIKTIQYSTRLSAANLAALVDASGNAVDVALSTLRSQAGGDVATNRVARNVYDAAGRPVYSIDESGAVSQLVYDGTGRITDTIEFATRITVPRSAGQLVPADLTTSGSPYLVTASADDRRTRNFYDNQGNQTGTLDAGGYIVERTFDNAGRVRQETRFANVVADTALRATGTLAQLKTAAGTDTETSTDFERDITTNYFYDGQSRVVGVLDGERYLTETVYDVAGNVSQTIVYNKVLTYSATSTMTSLRNAALASPAATTRTTSYLYDGFGHVTQSINHEGTQSNTTYDSTGNVVSATAATGAPDARTLQKRYDEMGRVVRELSGEGSQALATLIATNPAATQAQINDVWDRHGILYAYDVAGRRVSATGRPNDTQTNVTRYFYDADGRLRFEVNQLGERTEYRYDALGQATDKIRYFNRISTSGLSGGELTGAALSALTASADATRDARITYVYDVTGRVYSTTTVEGSTTTTTYNAFGDNDVRIDQIDATRSVRSEYTYTTRGELSTSRGDTASGGLNVTEARQYDAFGRLTRMTDARGNVSRTEYDRLGRETATVTAMNGRRVATYDGFSRVLTTRDALSNTTSYAYDEVARTMTVTTPEGIAVTTSFTRHGQTLNVTAAGNTTTYSYDLDGNLTGASDSLGGLEARTYDRAGRLETTTNARGVVTRLGYDAANRTLTRTEDHGAGNLQLVTVYGYDALGRVETVTEPSGRLTRTSYDRDGRVAEVAVDPNGLNLRTSYTYDRQNRQITVTEAVGAAQPKRTQYLYDNLGRRTEEIVDPASLGGTLNLRTQYRYDANGNVTRKIDAAGNSTWYVYDTLNRLTHTANALGNVWLNSYDAESHVTATRRYANTMSATTMATLAGLDSPVAANIAVSTNALDSLTRYFHDRDGREQYTIDALGTVTERVFDAAGRVTRTRVLSAPALTASFANAAAVTTALGSAATTIAAADRLLWTTYDLRGRAIFGIDGTGAVTRNDYDDSGNVVATTSYATRRSITDATDFASLQTWATANTSNTQNRTTKFWFDRLDRERFALDAEGYLTEKRYFDDSREQRDIVYALKPTLSANATLADVASAASAITTDSQSRRTISDLAGRVSRVYDAVGNYEEYTYDALGNKQTYRNQKGSLWTYVYDVAGRLTDERSPDVAITSVAHGGTALSSSHETASIVTRFTYDALGNVRTRTEGIRRYGNGSESTTGARTTTFNYDVVGRQTSTVNPQVTVYSGNYTETTGTTSQTTVTPTSTVTYDALGNATRNVDIGGGVSYRVYDSLGRLRYEIDALRYVTEHTFDVFGNETAITRFAAALGGIPSFSGNRIALSTMDTAVSGLRANAENRTITKVYDRVNRLRTTVESSVHVFEPGATTGAGQSFTASPTTYFDYDAFGKLVREWKLVNTNGVAVSDPAVNATANSWATTHHFYDRRGSEVATVNALRYLTRMEYDETGDLKNVREYAQALASFDIDATVAPTGIATTPMGGAAPDGGYDRETMFMYDVLNRRTSETLLNFEHAWINGLITEIRVQHKPRSFTYDAVGNQTSIAENGATVYNYYDVLGRLTARAEPARDPGDGTTLIPITEIKRDIFGNVAEEIRYGNGAATVNATTYTLAGTSAAAERHSLIQHDALDRAIASQDARGALRNAAYNARGDLVKEWQTVTNRATTDMGATPTTSVAETLVTMYQYDALGQRTASFEVQRTGGSPITVRSRATYNGFGEIRTKTTDGGWAAEFFEYDNTGRVWRSNTGDGVDKVYLYNLAGEVTAEIRSRTLNLADSTAYANAASVNALTGTMRTESRYDLLNRLIEQRTPQFEIAATQDLIDSQPQMAVVATPNPPNAIYRQVAVNGGSASYPGGWGGFVYVAQIVSHADGGGWYQVQAPSTANPYGVYARYSEAQYSVSQQRQFSWQKYGHDVIATFEYWPVGNPAAVSTLDIYTVAPDRVGVNVNALSGSYGYRISYKRVGAVSNFATQQGTFDTATNEVVRGASTALESQTATPTTLQAFDRWGNVISVRDAAGGLTQYRYNQLGQLTYTLLPSATILDTRFSIEQRVGRAQQSNYYDVNGRLFETRDGTGNTTRVFYNAAGQVTRQQNADHAAHTGGSEKQFVYDAFNNQIQVRDELGFRTRNVYDKADNLVQVAREIELAGFASASASDTSAANTANVLWEYYGYDETGRRTSETNGEGEVTKYWFDLRGNLIRSRTPRNFDTTFEYDAFARKTRETDANATFSTWTYDAFGRLTAHAEMVNSSSISSWFTAGGAVHAYTYDEAGLLTLETTSLGKNRALAYDAAAHLTSITDNGTALGGGLVSVNRVTTYNYDAAGRKAREREVIDGRVHQDTRIEYDGMGRIASLDDLDYRLQYFYDANGNRSLIRARYYDHQMVARLDEGYYRYDQMNRVTISQGMRSTGAVPDVIFDARQGVKLTYDAKGQRTSARTRGTRLETIEYRTNGVFSHITYNDFSPTDQLGTDFYAYDGLGRLKTLSRETHGIIRETTTGETIGGHDIPTAMSDYTYDKASRQISAIDRKNVGPNLNSHYTYTVYDDDGRSITQTNYNGGALESIVRFGDAGTTTATRYTGYDAANVLRGYTVEVYDAGTLKYTTSHRNAYRLGEGYQDTGQSVSSAGTTPPGPASTSRVYDVNGDLVQFSDSGDVTATRYFANNSNGQVLTSIKGQFDGQGGRMTVSQAWDAAVNRNTTNQPKAQYFFFVNGNNTGSFGQLQKSDGTFDANFDVNYTPVSSNYPASAPSQVIAQSGDTLRTIAARVFGDAALWYLLAEENGLNDPSAAIREGTVIKVPNEVVSLSNTAGVFKPFDSSEALGDMSPTQAPPPAPKPKKGGCGVIGMIIVAVVAIVLTVITAGAAAAALAPALGAMGSAVVGGAIGAAVGSIASQGVGIAIGVQDKFSWSAVAKAAIGGAIGGAMFGVTSLSGAAIKDVASTGLLNGGGAFARGVSSFAGAFGKASGFVQGAANAVVSNAITQGASMAFGLQEKFSWRDVAASAAGGGVSAVVGSSIDGRFGSSAPAGIATKTLTGFASGVTQSVAKGGKIDYASIAADAFGNALGNSLVEEIARGQMATVELEVSMEEDTLSDVATTKGGVAVNDIQKLLQEKAGSLNVQFDKDGTITSDLGAEVDKFLNGSETLKSQLKEFLTTKDSDGHLGKVLLLNDKITPTSFDPENNVVNINVGENGIKYLEDFIDAFAHELGHYKFDKSPLAVKKKFEPVEKRADGSSEFRGFDEFETLVVQEAVRFGRLTEAAAVLNEFKVMDEIKQSLGIDLAGLRSSESFKGYRAAYDEWLSAGSKEATRAQLLMKIGKEIGKVEHPHDPSQANGKATHTYETKWRRFAHKSAETAWRRSNLFTYWDRKLESKDRSVQQMQKAQASMKPGSAEWNEIQTFLRGADGKSGDLAEVELLKKKRGPK